MSEEREKVIEVEDLKKHYGQVKAVDGVSFYVERGQVFTLLGPNGAGKTTIVEILEGLKEPDEGRLQILGRECKKIDSDLKDKMGVLLQETQFLRGLRVIEVLNMFASFFSKSLPSEDILATVALQEKATSLVENLSGGQRQRLAMGLAIINDPEIIFMDEPTTGLDPQARHSIWELIEELKKEQKTIFLTTHYMEEAEKLSDFVYIMDHGKIIARGTPRTLIDQLQQENVIEFSRENFSDDLLQELQEIFPQLSVKDDYIAIFVQDLVAPFSQLIEWSRGKSLEFKDLMFRRPNLEDVFLTLTGKGLRD